MSDDEARSGPPAQGALGSWVDEALADDRTRGVTVATVGPDLGGVSFTVSDEKRETSVALCAQVLLEHLDGLDVDRTEFVRDVVNELNERPVEESEKWGPRDDE